MEALPLRIPPGTDLRRSLETAVGARAAFVVSGIGSHVSYGCSVRTTGEVLVLLLPEWSLTREHDPATGFAELVVQRKSGAP
jgi:predicted DNA-binding protein with PD1-like motif